MDPPGPEPDDRPDTSHDVPAAPAPDPATVPAAAPDLERIAGDLADIEVALDRLTDGTYWTDEITGETIPDDVLAEDPTARRVAYVPSSQQATPPPEPATDPAGEPVDAGDPPTAP